MTTCGTLVEATNKINKLSDEHVILGHMCQYCNYSKVMALLELPAFTTGQCEYPSTYWTVLYIDICIYLAIKIITKIPFNSVGINMGQSFPTPNQYLQHFGQSGCQNLYYTYIFLYYIKYNFFCKNKNLRTCHLIFSSFNSYNL